MSKNIIEMSDIHKSFNAGKENELEILHGLDFQVEKGEFVAVVGASGSGKSTLMNIIGVLDRATIGNYILDGVSVNKADDGELSSIRNKFIGFVFQNFNLIPRTDALHNVEVPLLYAGIGGRARRDKSKELLEMVGMGDRMDHMPNELSGGQKQRVAIARAMVNDPSIILADEPTGALDSKTGHMVMDLFHELHEKHGKTIILITHDHKLASETQRTYTMSDGLFVPEEEA